MKKILIFFVIVLSNYAFGQAYVWEKINPNVFNSVICINSTLWGVVSGDSIIYKSEDMGVNWEIQSSIQEFQISQMYSDGTLIWLSGQNSEKAAFSSDYGETWNIKQVESNIAVFRIDSTNNIYAGTVDGNLYVSRNNGDQWTNIYSNPGKAIKNIIPVDSSTLFAVYEAKNIYKTTDSGELWTDYSSNFISNSELGVFANGILFTSGRGIYPSFAISADTGKTWHYRIHEYLSGSVLAINNQECYAGGPNVFSTSLDTSNFTRRGMGVANKDLYGIIFKDNYIFVYSDLGIFRTDTLFEPIAPRDFMPLQVGNKWQFKRHGYALGDYYNSIFTRVVTDTIWNSGKLYYRFGDGIQPVRYDTSSNRLYNLYNNSEHEYIDFDNPHGSMISIRYNDNIYLSEIYEDSIEIVGKKYLEKSVYVPGWETGYYSFTTAYASGIGFSSFSEKEYMPGTSSSFYMELIDVLLYNEDGSIKLHLNPYRPEFRDITYNTNENGTEVTLQIFSNK